MAQAHLYFLALFLKIRIYFATNIDRNEYCAGESFNPQCQAGELILMKLALYGQMSLGRCLPNDIGFLGCQSDVLAQFDQECSGKESCGVFVTETHIRAQGGCMKGLTSYLDAEYACVKALDIADRCESGHQTVIDASKAEFYLADMQLSGCASRHKGLVIQAKDGQVMNISQINLQKYVSHGDIYGTVKDAIANKEVVIGDGPREKHALFSSSNEVEITVSENDGVVNRFMLHITVSGCPNMPPPDGAWMTRDGDVMEIGCHSGAKTWSLKCEENQWVGAVGQCGEISDRRKSQKVDSPVVKSNNSSESVSINAMLFGISSLTIFLSAVIFLIGVCLLKRKFQSPMYNNLPVQKGVPTVLNEAIATNLQTLPNRLPPQQMFPINDIAMEPGYRSFRLAQSTNAPIGQKTEGDSPPAYINTTGSDASDSVKYYVLEDNTKYK